MGEWDVIGTSPVAKPQAQTAPAQNGWDVVGQTEQMKGPMRIPAMIASNAGEGLAALGGVPGDLEDLAEAGGTAIRKAITGDGTPYPRDPFRIRSRDIIGVGKKLGVFERPDLAPQDTTEKYIAAGSRGAGASIPLALSGGTAAPFILGSGITSGLGSQLGEDLFPKHPIAGGFFGGMLGGAGLTGLTNTGGRVINASRGIGNEMTDAYRTAGITPRLAGDASDSKVLKGLQAFAAKSPASMARVGHAADQTAGEFGNAAEGIASQLGRAQTMQDVGTALQGQSKAWMDRFKMTNANNWGALDGMFPTGVKVSNYQKTLGQISEDLPQAGNTAKVLQPGLTSQLKQALAADLGDNTGQQITDALPWQAVKGIRTRLGEMLEDPNLPADTSTAEIKRLYAALTNDMKAAAKAAGPKAEEAFNNANAFTSKGHDFIDNVLRPIIKDGQTPEGAAGTVLPKLNKGGTLIDQLRQEMPDAANEVAAFKVRDMASALAGRQNAAGNAVSPSTFLTDWNKLSPEAKQALFEDPAVQKKLAAMAKVSEGIKATLAKMNHSNTAAHADWKDALGLPGRIAAAAFAGHTLGAEAGLGTHGALIGAGAMLAPEIGGWTAGRLTTSPRLTSYFAAPGVIDPRTGRLLAGVGTYGGMQRALNAPSN